VDCSHANSNKQFERQPSVLDDCVDQIVAGNKSIVGVMLESNLQAGNQSIPNDLNELQYGVSVTDSCIDWQTTEEILLRTRDKLRLILPKR
ncbi:MAG TPA: 3-deoxy-7-phosphoheptulonate synthase, partial [Gammaproteobacteria bacterium]|nr:3-deoxy-7-phosphoheptulonate synthase [Gammaproteobacteria bacterium]